MNTLRPLSINKMKHFYFLTFITAVFLSACMPSNKEADSEKVLLKFTGPIQGTIYNISIVAAPKDTVLVDSIAMLLDRIDQSLSTYKESSIISRINDNDTSVVVDELFTEVFNRSQEIAKTTNGAFDVTVAPLVNFWGFGPESYPKEIDSTQVADILQYIGYDKVKLEEGRLIKQNPNMSLDFNAIAQGYSVDLVCRLLEDKGIENMIVEIGGELRAKGTNLQGRTWTVGVDKPIAGIEYAEGKDRYQFMIKLEDKALATSGNYRKFYEKDGKKISHTINPKTGFPVEQSLLSATVISDDCMTADAYATAFMVMGLEKAKELLANHPELQAYLVYGDDSGEFQTFATEGIKDLIKE